MSLKMGGGSRDRCLFMPSLAGPHTLRCVRCGACIGFACNPRYISVESSVLVSEMLRIFHNLGVGAMPAVHYGEGVTVWLR